MTRSPGFLRRKWRLCLFLAGILTVVAVIARPLLHLGTTVYRDDDTRAQLPAGFLDDASRMNATPMNEVFAVPADAEEAKRLLADLLGRATREGLKVSVAGTRHSMGGHTLYPGGIAVDMLPFRTMRLDEERELLTVGAGAIWKDVIAYLDARGRSVGVMQSNNSFSVGGSVSVNCHGWQYGAPPIASTVESLRLMLADGSIKRCSRTENAELFSVVLGGYGLFGIILDVELRVVPNERYRLEQFVVPTTQGFETYEREVASHDGVAMVYARLGIVPDDFLNEVILTVFTPDPAPDGSLAALLEPKMIALRRTVFRGSVGSDYGKELRWMAEAQLQPHLKDSHFTRNQLLNEGVEVFENRSADSTDILHEYFVPRAGTAAFVKAVQRIVPAHGADLLNVTVRYVTEDTDTVLRYADGPMFAFVMLFNQARSAAADTAMSAMTRELIDASLEHGGRYYLPYRLHASREQFQRAYPMSARFFELKRKYDPNGIFRNRFYETYGPEIR